MTTIRTTLVCTTDELAARRMARNDIVAESPDGVDRWGLAHGPFRDYERTLRIEPRNDGDFDVEAAIVDADPGHAEFFQSRQHVVIVRF